MNNRAIVYIDGYNWYHAIFKHHPEWKWLNIQSFFEALRPHGLYQAFTQSTAQHHRSQRQSYAL